MRPFLRPQHFFFEISTFPLRFDTLCCLFHHFGKIICHESLYQTDLQKRGFVTGEIWYFTDWLMIPFIIWNSNLVPLLEGLCTSNPRRFEFSNLLIVPDTCSSPRSVCVRVCVSMIYACGTNANTFCRNAYIRILCLYVYTWCTGDGL